MSFNNNNPQWLEKNIETETGIGVLCIEYYVGAVFYAGALKINGQTQEKPAYSANFNEINNVA